MKLHVVEDHLSTLKDFSNRLMAIVEKGNYSKNLFNFILCNNI